MVSLEDGEEGVWKEGRGTGSEEDGKKEKIRVRRKKGSREKNVEGIKVVREERNQEERGQEEREME